MGRTVVNKKLAGKGLTLIMSNPAISGFENSVDPDKLELIRILTVFYSACRYMHIITGILKADWI